MSVPLGTVPYPNWKDPRSWKRNKDSIRKINDFDRKTPNPKRARNIPSEYRKINKKIFLTTVPVPVFN